MNKLQDIKLQESHGNRGFGSTVMMTYTGKNKKLVSGNQYSRHDLAKAFDVSYQVACNKLQGKREAIDSCFWRKTVRLVKFVGEHGDLITNNHYTLQELGAVCGLTGNAMYQRIKKRPVCTARDLRITKEKEFDPLSSPINFRWLRRKIV